MRLAAREGIVGKVRVCVSVVEVPACGKSNAVLIAIGAVVVGALGHAKVSSLVNGNVCLVDLAAARSKSRVVEPRAAENDEVLRGKGISNSTLAVVLDVPAVQVGKAAAAGVCPGHLLKGRGDSVAGALAGALKVLNHLVGRTVAGGLGSLDGNVVRVLDGGLDGSALGTGAIAVDGDALLQRLEAAERLGGRGAVDAGANLVGLV